MGVSIQSTVALFTVLFLTGCPIYDSADTVIHLETMTSGTFKVSIFGLGSDEDDPMEREKELARLIYEIADIENIQKKYTSQVQGRISETGKGVTVTLVGRFHSKEALSGLFEIETEDGRLVHAPSGSEKIISTNGRVEKNKLGKTIIAWPLNTRKFSHSLRYIQPSTGKPWDQKHSLLPEYKKYKKNPEYFKKILVNRKLEDEDNASGGICPEEPKSSLKTENNMR